MDTSELDNSSCLKLGGVVKQVDEKHAASDMREMIWSSKMDLVAAITLAEPSEVILYRLHALKKMWTHSPPVEGAKVTSVAWDPMGKCIAVGYTNKQVMILAVEKAEVLYTHDLVTIPSKLCWLSLDQAKKDTKLPFYKDISEKLLPKLPSVNREKLSNPSVKMINQDTLNYLVVSGEGGAVNIYVYGLLSIALIDLQSYCSQELKISSSCLSTSGSHLVSVAESAEGDLYLCSLVTHALYTRREDIQIIADKFVRLIGLLEHCDSSITKMTEAWEDGLLELDSKLNHFSTQKQLIGEGTVLNDFLELLLFGTPSDELKVFLKEDLSERGMKKLGASLQTYYKTMQELLTVNMQVAVESIFYHLNDLLGLSQWTDAFGAIGLDTGHVDTAIQACSSLRLKINEMQALLSSGNKNLKAFSAWLYTVILRLANQPIPNAIEAALPDYNDVADFLNENFRGLEENGSRIKLERVGQYLKDCDLTSPPKPSENSLWSSLDKFPHLSASKLMYKSQPTKSLIQLYKQLSVTIREALTTPSVTVAKTMLMETNKKLASRCILHRLRQFPVQDQDDVQHVYSIYLIQSGEDNSNLKLFVTKLALQEDCSTLYKAELKFGQLGQNASLYSCSSHRIVDFDYYNNEEIVALLQQSGDDNSKSYLTIRLNLTDLTADKWSADWSCDTDTPPIDVGELVNLSYVKILQNAVNALQISVSGKRDIGSVMLSNRRVRLYMYDVDDESDEEESMSQEATAADDATIGSDKENMS